MKFKHLIYLPLLVVCSSLIYTFSATLQLTKIGALDLAGKTYPEWWYTGTNPMFVGMAAADSTVTLKINDTSYTTTSNSSGNWSYTASMPAGDYTVVVSQGSESYSFKLHLGQNLPSTLTSQTTQSTTSVPETGFNQTSALAFGMGIVLLATYLYMWGDQNRKVVFEKRFLKEE